MPDTKPTPTSSIEVKDIAVIMPLIASLIALTWEVGAFLPTGGFGLFSLSDHLLAAINTLPSAIGFAAIIGLGAFSLSRIETTPGKKPSRLMMLSAIGLSSALCVASIYYYYSGRGSLPLVFPGAFVGLLLFLWFELKPQSPPGITIITLIFLSTTLATSADFTLARMRRSSEIATTIATKSGTVTGTVIMLGSSGILLYRKDQNIVHFEKMDEIKNVEWPR